MRTRRGLQFGFLPESFAVWMVGCRRITAKHAVSLLKRRSGSTCVELNMMGHTIAAHFHTAPIDRRELRGYAVDEVMRTNGQISFDDALDQQRRLEDDDTWRGSY